MSNLSISKTRHYERDYHLSAMEFYRDLATYQEAREDHVGMDQERDPLGHFVPLTPVFHFKSNDGSRGGFWNDQSKSNTYYGQFATPFCRHLCSRQLRE